jgi:putative hydrolase of the HAD superfamily
VRVVLFDVFGTLVSYAGDVTALPYPGAHALLAGWGWAGSHDDFVTTWASAAAVLEAAAVASRREYSMLDAAAAFAPDLGADRHRLLVDAFLADWLGGVRPVDGVAAMLERLAGRHRLGVVSNTAAAAAMRCAPADAVFVGDTFDADYEGPTAAGMCAYLIDPGRRHVVPDGRRLGTVLDLEAALSTG